MKGKEQCKKIYDMFNLLRRDYFLTWLRVLLNDFLYCICYNGCFHGSMRICYMFVIVNSFMYKHDKGVPWVYVLCLEVICHIIFTAVGRVWIKWGKGGEFRQILNFFFFLFAFNRLHLPFQKWGICLHCATAMILISFHI